MFNHRYGCIKLCKLSYFKISFISFKIINDLQLFKDKPLKLYIQSWIYKNTVITKNDNDT